MGFAEEYGTQQVDMLPEHDVERNPSWTGVEVLCAFATEPIRRNKIIRKYFISLP